MPKGYTLRKLLSVVDTTLSSLYTIELVSAKGIKLTFRRYINTPNAVTVTCFRPGKPTCGWVFNTSQVPWHELVRSKFHLRLDVPCWNVHPQTFVNIAAISTRITEIKDEWETFKRTADEKENAP